MHAESRRAAPAPRLNPFAFPSETDFRFALLVVSVLGSCMFIYNWLSNVVPGNAEALVETAARCADIGPQDWSAALGSLSASGEVTAEQADFLAASQAYAECIAPYNQALAGWITSGVAFMLAVAVGLYWFFPALKLRRDRLVPLSAEDVPEVVAYLEVLSQQAGLTRPPTFVWNPLNQAPSGVAFGRVGRRYVALSGGLVRLFYRDPPAFRAVVLHELAHLRNADVDKAYFAVAVAVAFAVAALLPFGVSLLGQSPELVFSFLWRVLVLTALVYLTLAAVLRARELYADVRASIWDGPGDGLRRMLETLPHARGERWRSALRVHPDPGQRVRTLADTSALFRIGFWEAFATGLAVAIAVPSVQSVISLVTTLAQDSTLAALLTGLVFGPLVVGIVGAGVWRATFASLARGEAPPSVGRLALGVTLGLVLGQVLSVQAALEQAMGGASNLLGSLVFNALWGGLAFMGLFLLLRWICAAAVTWLEATAQGGSPRAPHLAGAVVAGGGLAVWFAVLFYARSFDWLLDVPPDALTSLALPVVLVVVLPLIDWWLLPAPVTILAVAGLWAFPLAAWLWRERAAAGSGAHWGFLDSPAPQFPPAARSRFFVGQALMAALVAALLFCALLLAVRIGVRVGVADTVGDTPEFRLGFFYGQVGLAVLLQAAAAVLVAVRSRWLAAVHGLFSAFVAACAMAVGLLGLNLLFGGTADPPFVLQVFWTLISGGALLVLPAALAGAALAGWRGRGQPGSESSPPAPVAAAP